MGAGGSGHIMGGTTINAEHPLAVEIIGGVNVSSMPPSGMCRITNIYWDPEQERVCVVYDETPQE